MPFTARNLISNITPGNPFVAERLSGYTQFFMTKGAAAPEARQQALRLLDSGIVRQTNLLSFADAYLLIGSVFLLALPLLLLAVQKKNKQTVVMLSDH